MNRERMKELAEAQFLERQKETTITLSTEEADVIQINERAYRLVQNYREAYDETKVAARFSSFLEKYDYLVGDIAAEQLRFRGFYKTGTEGVPRNQQINALADYIYEEINFGAPYFVLENLAPHAIIDEEELAQPKKRTRRRRNNNHGSGSGNRNNQNNKAEVQEKRRPVHKGPGRGNNKQNNNSGGNREVRAKGRGRKRRFEVRERSETNADAPRSKGES